MDREVPKSVLRREKRKRMLIVLAVLCGVAMVAALLLYLFSNGVRRSELVFSEVDRGSLDVSMKAGGVVVPAVEYAVVSPIASRILQAYRQNGDSVRAGDALLQLDLAATQLEAGRYAEQLEMKEYELEQLRAQSASTVSDMKMQLEVAEMKIEQKATELRNERRMDSVGGGTPGKVQAAEIALKVLRLEANQLKERIVNAQRIARASDNIKGLETRIARKNYDLAAKTLEEAKIAAPIDGVITFINTQVGSQVGLGQQVATVAAMDRLRVDGELPDSYAGRVAAGQRVEVRSGTKQLEGTVVSLAPTSKNGVIGVRVQLSDSASRQLRPGLRVDLFIQASKRLNALRIANGSYYTKPGIYEMFVVEGGNIVRRSVRLGESNYDYVEVVSGLREGEEVVVSDAKVLGNANKLKLR